MKVLRKKLFFFVPVIIFLLLKTLAFNALALSEPKLSFAQMCERIYNGQCIGPSVVFSVEKRQVFCYTTFDNVSKPVIIYHRWYHRGELSTQIRIKIEQPGTPAVSAIQLREADKGPWQVEVVDITGKVYTVLRFSITD